MNIIKKINKNTRVNIEEIIELFQDSFLILKEILIDFDINKYILYKTDNILSVWENIIESDSELLKVGDQLLIFESLEKNEYTKITWINWNFITFSTSLEYEKALIIWETYDANFNLGLKFLIFHELKAYWDFKNWNTWNTDLTVKIWKKSISEKISSYWSWITDYLEKALLYFQNMEDYNTENKINNINEKFKSVEYIIT